jgi:Asp-tRNA(Asn)/Glu-tRNA(Gln) amidotransferase A subunit family amidase
MNMSSSRFLAVTCLALISALVLPTAIAQKSGGEFQVVETSIDAIHAAMKSGRLTSHELVQLYLDRIAAYDKSGPKINCVITLNPKALEEADRLDAEFKKGGFAGPLHGIPILVKDQVDAAGMPTTLGTVVFKDYNPPLDSFVVAKLRKAGAIILGKTTLSEFAGGDTFGSLFGVTRNAYDLERTVGGSSGGSGAALTVNFSTIAVGEEGFASIRRPGAWNSVVSMRPTPGLVSRTGMYDGYPSPVGSLGPMGRTVRDMTELLDVMVGYDPEDPITALGFDKSPVSYTKFLDKDGLKGSRIGVIHQVFGDKTQPDSDDFKQVDDVFNKAIAEMEAAGATVIPIEIPNLGEIIATMRASKPGDGEEGMKLWMSRNPNSPYKTREDVTHSPLISQVIPPSKQAQWTPNTKKPDPARYYKFLEVRNDLDIQIAKIMADNKLDAIVHKTDEHTPTLLKDGLGPPYYNQLGVTSLNTFLIYAASMNVPAGFTSGSHLPVGITFYGRPYSEPKNIKLAYSFEQATHHRIPPTTTPPLPMKKLAEGHVPVDGATAAGTK